MPTTCLTRAALAALAATTVFSLSACQTDATSTPSRDQTAAMSQPSGSADPSASAAATGAESASPTPTGPRTPQTPAANLEAITVTGEPGQPPAVAFTAPFGVAETITKALTEGTGTTVGEHATVEVYYHGVNGATGENFDENFTSGATASFPLDGVVAGFKKGLQGQKVGSRVLIAMPGKDGYDPSGGNAKAGIELGDSLIFVVDIVAASLSEPQGEPQRQDPADPQVSDDLLNPTVTVPPGWTPPAETTVKYIVKGGGAEVQAADTLTMNWLMVSGRTGQPLVSSFDKQPESAPLGSLIPAFNNLAGVPVGSRVLLLVAPADAYGAKGNTDPSIGPDEPLIFVVDVLQVVKQ